MAFEKKYAYAKECDEQDNLGAYRSRFNFPEKDGHPYIYLCGNSLGLQPKNAVKVLEEDMTAWSEMGIKGYFNGDSAWIDRDKDLSASMAKVVGAKASEVVVMNTLTVNLHFMMVSFYRPSSSRYKILIESDAFPSDRYVVESQIRFHGYDPGAAIIKLSPKTGEDCLRLEDIRSTIDEHGSEIALILIGNTNYYTGQFYDMKSITAAGHAKGCKVGFDCAHAAGNVPLDLHDANVDFAVWCTYKYLNSGPGSIGGCFVHERHLEDKNIPKLTGWWGHHRESRFGMREDFEPAPGALSWQVSCPPVLAMSSMRASLDIFVEAGIDSLRAKSIKLTGYLEYLINELQDQRITIITPSDHESRGCQLSIKVDDTSKQLYDNLIENGVIVDWREPNVIRVAPAPLYNSFVDIFRFVEILKAQLDCS